MMHHVSSQSSPCCLQKVHINPNLFLIPNRGVRLTNGPGSPMFLGMAGVGRVKTLRQVPGFLIKYTIRSRWAATCSRPVVGPGDVWGIWPVPTHCTRGAPRAVWARLPPCRSMSRHHRASGTSQYGWECAPGHFMFWVWFQRGADASVLPAAQSSINWQRMVVCGADVYSAPKISGVAGRV